MLAEEHNEHTKKEKKKKKNKNKEKERDKEKRKEKKKEKKDKEKKKEEKVCMCVIFFYLFFSLKGPLGSSGSALDSKSRVERRAISTALGQVSYKFHLMIPRCP